MYKIVSAIYFACKVHFDLRKEMEKTVTFSCFPLIRMFNNNLCKYNLCCSIYSHSAYYLNEQENKNGFVEQEVRRKGDLQKQGALSRIPSREGAADKGHLLNTYNQYLVKALNITRLHFKLYLNAFFLSPTFTLGSRFEDQPGMTNLELQVSVERSCMTSKYFQIRSNKRLLRYHILYYYLFSNLNCSFSHDCKIDDKTSIEQVFQCPQFYFQNMFEVADNLRMSLNCI